MHYAAAFCFLALFFLSAFSLAASPTTQPLDSDVLSEIQIAFHPSVFSGKKFPNFDFTQPHLVHELLGHCKQIAKFYDAAMNEVESPAAPGRYGAVVTVIPENGQPFKRFITLYHSPQRVVWRIADLHPTLEFLDSLGLSGVQTVAATNFLRSIVI